MTDTEQRTSQGMVDVVLEGGPVGFPGTSRIRSEPKHVQSIKVPYHGGYEHFERVRERGHSAVFQWTMRTRVAE